MTAWDKGGVFNGNNETFSTGSWEIKSFWHRDGINPNKRGNGAIARNLKKIIRSSRHRSSEKSSQHAPYHQTAAYVNYDRDISRQRGHHSAPVLHQHGHPATCHSPAHYTPPADTQDRRTYSGVVSYGATKTQASQVHREHDQPLLVSPLQYQQTAASSLKQPHRAVPPVHQMSTPDYKIFQRDAVHRGKTDMGLHVHKSIAYITKRRADLESDRVECIWVGVKHSSSNATLVRHVYRNPAVTYAVGYDGQDQ